LPYVAQKLDGVWVWWETGENLDPSRWRDKRVLHFASTSRNELAYERPGVGGFYTAEFCGIGPCDEVTLGERLDRIQAGIERRLAYSPLGHNEAPRRQHHRLYSSHKLDFQDTTVFDIMRSMLAG
ncbi:hypothetical protein FRC08_001314, partial [Ceratobasidium sp. 394]